MNLTFAYHRLMPRYSTHPSLNYLLLLHFMSSGFVLMGFLSRVPPILASIEDQLVVRNQFKSSVKLITPPFVRDRSHLINRHIRNQCAVSFLQPTRERRFQHHLSTRQFTSVKTKATKSNWQENPKQERRNTQFQTNKPHFRPSKSSSPKLDQPKIIYSNNHLLVVNKPPGWKSQPGDATGSSNSGDTLDAKCLLTNLKNQSLGGGSLQNFLIPTHRLDQPCTGLLIFAKNGKSASRVQVAWAKQQVDKCYWVVVEGGREVTASSGKMNGLELLQSRSIKLSKDRYRLSAVIQSGKNISSRANNIIGGSVIVRPIPPSGIDEGAVTGNGRVCHIEWNHMLRLPDTPYSTTRHILSIKTDTGAKHQVRAMLAIAGGAPVAGDLRYGNNINAINRDGGRVHEPLPDQSVALHARSVFLPTVSLGGMDFLKEKPFVADIPGIWGDLFGISEDDLKFL